MIVTMARIVTMAHIVPWPQDIHSGNASWRRSLALTLTALAILTIGILVGLVVGNRVLTMQLAIYGEATIEAPSMTLNLMTDFLDQPLSLPFRRRSCSQSWLWAVGCLSVCDMLLCGSASSQY